MKITYRDSGIDYSKIDPLKVIAQKAAKSTASNLAAKGFSEVSQSRGESAYVMDMGDFYIASVTECLGTKSLIADRMAEIEGKSYYESIAKDTVAMAVNDLASCGAVPLAVHAYWATSGSHWFDDEKRMESLVRGWKDACDEAGASWGGGETPGLSGIIAEGSCDLAASCVGIVRPRERLCLGDRLTEGDAIVFLSASGIHANGVSLARALAGRLPDGYKTHIPGGRSYGDALLDPTPIYAKIVEKLFDGGVDIKYISNITGHGFRKIMRHPSDFEYIIDTLPPVPKVLEFIAKEAGLESKEAYGTFNMGAGYALFVAVKDADKTIELCANAGTAAYRAGYLVKGKRSVVIKPIGITFEAESLDLRG